MNKIYLKIQMLLGKSLIFLCSIFLFKNGSISKRLKIELITIKLLGKTRKKIKRSKNGEHVPTCSLFLHRVFFLFFFAVLLSSFIVFNSVFNIYKSIKIRFSTIIKSLCVIISIFFLTLIWLGGVN